MNFEKIHIIINPASGKQEPILSYLNNALQSTSISWEVLVTKKDEDAFKIAEKLAGKTDLVAVYGGDGTIAEAARALFGKKTPLAIIPGGTANVVSKELTIPQDSIAAINLLVSGRGKIIPIDMGTINGNPFLIRINLGIMADMILHADRELKNSFGQLAYGVTAFQSLSETEPMEYKMMIDGKEIVENGVAVTVTNAGNIGFGTFSFLPGIVVTDGYLDLILMNNTDPMSVLRVAGATLFQMESDVLKHWKCKDVIIEMDQPHKYIEDDCEKEAKTMHIKVVPGALNVLVPESFNP